MIFNSPERYKETFAAVLRTARAAKRETKFAALAFTGVSGSSLGFPIALELDISPIYVRKDRTTNEDEFAHSHSSMRVEGPVGYDLLPYAFVDDFISSGKTYDRVVKALGHPPVAIIVRNGGSGVVEKRTMFRDIPAFNSDLQYV
jgi:adenine/guanine phosphoribosyltransferase-like PRPP-binding protein